MIDRTHTIPAGRALATLALGLALGSFSVPALAGDLEYREMRKLRQSGEIRPLAELLEKAQAVHQGELLEAELEEHDDALVYEIELLTPDGEVWELFFDARTGELLESDSDSKEED